MTDPPINPRKQPRQKRAQATVAVIVEAAARILEEAGLDAFNTNAVADRAGVSVGSLYQYFPNKAALMAALVRRDNEAFLQAMKMAASHDHGELKDRIRRLVDVAIDHQFAQPRLARILDLHQRHMPPEDQDLAVQEEIVRLIGGLVLEAGVPADRLRQASIDLIGLSRGMIDAAATSGDPTPAGLNDRVCRALFGYLQLPGA